MTLRAETSEVGFDMGVAWLGEAANWYLVVDGQWSLAMTPFTSPIGSRDGGMAGGFPANTERERR